MRKVSLLAWFGLCALIVSVGNSYIAYAQGSGGIMREDDYESLINETTFYDLVPLGSCGAAAEAEGVTLEGKDNIQRAFNYFIAQGLTPVQSAGIVGNLRQESGVNPASNNTAAGRAGVSPSSIIPGERWNGGGIAQWEDYKGTPTRWTGDHGLLKYVAGKGKIFSGKPRGDGKNWKVLEYQLDFIWWEMRNTHKAAMKSIKSATTIEAAVLAFLKDFEKAGDPRTGNRVKFAKQTLDAFGGLVPDNVAPSGACGGTGIVVDGYAFPVAPQTRRSYTTLPCTAGKKPAQTLSYKGTQITTCHHDGTPAFDLMYDGVPGKAVYAITKGKIIKVNRSYVMASGAKGKPCGSIQFQSTNGTESTYYWYGHILPGNNVTTGKEFEAGDQLGVVATRDYGKKCWGGGPHLHIDRGCIEGNTPKQGGGDGCRDPQFLQDLQKIWEGLPQP
jgi:hypothetical protein